MGGRGGAGRARGGARSESRRWGPGGRQIREAPAAAAGPASGAMEGSPIPVLTVPTAPYEDQRPTGGGGLRRPTVLFEGQRNYLPNFIQSVLSSIDLRDRQGCTMVVGSDGRYFSKTATEIVVQMAAANGVSDSHAPFCGPRARATSLVLYSASYTSALTATRHTWDTGLKGGCSESPGAGTLDFSRTCSTFFCISFLAHFPLLPKLWISRILPTS